MVVGGGGRGEVRVVVSGACSGGGWQGMTPVCVCGSLAGCVGGQEVAKLGMKAQETAEWFFEVLGYT